MNHRIIYSSDSFKNKGSFTCIFQFTWIIPNSFWNIDFCVA